MASDKAQDPSIKELYKDFGESTSMHGLGRVISSKPLWKRVIWMLLVLAGASWAAYQLIQIIQEFQSHPVSSVVSIEHEDALEFPAITICNLNRIRWSETPDVLRQRTHEYKYYADTLERQWRYFDGDLMLYAPDKSREDMGHTIDDMLVKCFFDAEPCTVANITGAPYYNMRYGNCYTYGDSPNEVNTRVKHRYTKKPGPDNGLILELNAEHYDYHPLTPTAGVKVILHPPNEVAFPEDGGIDLPTGFSTNINVRKSVTHRLSPPYGDCISPSLTRSLSYNMFNDDGYAYTAFGCRKTCYQMSVYRSCDCCDDGFPCIDDALKKATGRMLDPDQWIDYCNITNIPVEECVSRQADLYTKGSLSCLKECKPACDPITYHTTVSAATWPADTYIEDYVRGLNDSGLFDKINGTSIRTLKDAKDFVLGNFLQVKIYYESLDYEKIKTTPAYDWSRLLGDIGGQLGLWLGFSLLTAVELLELLMDSVMLLARRICNRNKTTSVSAFKE